MRKAECSSSNVNSIWGKYGSHSWVMAIANVLEFIRKAESLVTQFSVLESEVYSVATTNVIRRSIPFRYREMQNETFGRT